MMEEQSAMWGVGSSPKALSGQVLRKPPNSVRKEREASHELNGQVGGIAKEARPEHHCIPGSIFKMSVPSPYPYVGISWVENYAPKS